MSHKNYFYMPKQLEIIFRSLRYRNYRLYFFGQSISVIGIWIQRIAMPWLVYRITGSEFLLGLVSFTGQICTFLLAPFAGVWCERLNLRNVLITTQVLSIFYPLALAILFFTGDISVWHIMMASIFLGCVNAFDMPARHSFVIEMVENREDLANAIALNSSMVNSARLLGPSIAGVLIAVSNEGVCFLINSLSYIFVITSLLLMKVPPKEKKIQDTHILHDLKEGLLYVFGFPPIRAVILLLALVSLFSMPYSVLMPVLAKDILHGDSYTFGFLMAASGVGALAGALYLASRKSVLGIGKIIPLSAATFGLGVIALSLSRIFLLSLILMLLAGFGMITQMASSNTMLQTLTDDDKRARVMSFYTMAFVGTAPFGSLLAGILADTIGVPNTLMISGVVCLLGAIVFARKLPELRKHIRPIYVKLGIIPEIASAIQTTTELTDPPER